MEERIEKALAGAYENITGSEVPINPQNDKYRRGYNVYTMSQLLGISGRDKSGSLIHGQIEQPIFYLSLEERTSIFRLCAPVHGVITSRMNRISALKWKITSDKKQEDKIVFRLKNLKQVYDEYAGNSDLRYIVASGKIRQELMNELPDLLPDLSNFNKSLLRWHKKNQQGHTDKCDMIEAWLRQPNIEDKWEDFTKKWVCDLLQHGGTAVYKELLSGKIENIYVMPGGTVMPMKNKFVGGQMAFVQIMQGYEPQVFFTDELSYASYIPTSARAYGFIPLEALINKIAETLLFDKVCADMADGTKLPEKLVIVTDNNPFGDLNKEQMIPLDGEEQKRIETKLSQPKKGAIMTFSGNNVQVVDLTRENTFQFQNERQKDIRSEVAFVFQATNMEINLTGSDDTSGRSTSESQAMILKERGIFPLVQKLENQINFDILPFRFGTGYRLEFDSELSEKEQMELLKLKMDTGLYSVNEVRINDLNEDPVDGEEYDKPQARNQASGDQSNPLYTKNVE